MNLPGSTVAVCGLPDIHNMTQKRIDKMALLSNSSSFEYHDSGVFCSRRVWGLLDREGKSTDMALLVSMEESAVDARASILSRRADKDL